MAQTAPIRRKGTPIPKHVQMGRYHPSNTASLRQVDERGDQYADTAIIDTRDEVCRAQEVRATPTSTEHRVTIRDVEDLSYTAPRTMPEKTMAITYPQLSAINATPAEVATGKVSEIPEAARVAPPSALATTEDATPKDTPTIGVTKLVTLPKMADSPKITTWSLQEIKQFADWCQTHQLSQMSGQEQWNLISQCFPQDSIDVMETIVLGNEAKRTIRDCHFNHYSYRKSCGA